MRWHWGESLLAVLVLLGWLTLVRTPWTAGNRDFSWYVRGCCQVSTGIYGIATSWELRDGYHYFDMFWSRPMMLRYHVISSETAALLDDDRVWPYTSVYDVKIAAQLEMSRYRDDKHEWRWPK